GGAYAAFNSYATGADVVLALPTTRVAVMGTGGKEFVYKTEIRKMRDEAAKKRRTGVPEVEVVEWVKAREAELNQRYERELMNPREALSLGSISEIVMPTDLRRVLTHQLRFLLNHYVPGPVGGPQRESHGRRPPPVPSTGRRIATAGSPSLARPTATTPTSSATAGWASRARPGCAPSRATT